MHHTGSDRKVIRKVIDWNILETPTIFKSIWFVLLLSPLQVLPSVVSYSSAISACEKSLKWEMALVIFADMPLGHVSKLQILMQLEAF